jgi:hypothetical protein
LENLRIKIHNNEKICFNVMARPVSGSGSAVGTSDFDAQMYGIKIYKGDETLKPVNKKPFSNIEWLLAFLDFLVHKKYTLTLL